LHPAAGITDFSAITAFRAAPAAVREAASLPAPYPDETPRFIIAPEDYLFGTARMFELVANRPNAKPKVLRSREEAWLCLEFRTPVSRSYLGRAEAGRAEESQAAPSLHAFIAA
jgi:hypothetical protein